MTAAEAWLTFVLLIGGAALGLLQVALRYLFGLGWPWGNGIIVMLTVWGSLFAASAGLERGTHIGLDMLVERLAGRARRAAEYAIQVATLTFLGFLLVYSLRYLAFLYASGGQSLLTYLPAWVEFLGVPVAVLLMCLHVAHRIVRLARAAR